MTKKHSQTNAKENKLKKDKKACKKHKEQSVLFQSFIDKVKANFELKWPSWSLVVGKSKLSKQDVAAS